MSISLEEARQIYHTMPPDEQRKVQQIGNLNGQINAVAEWKRRQTGGMQIQPPPQQSASDIAAMCKSTNKIPELQSSLNECRSPEEASRSNSFIVSTTNPKSDFDMLNANYNNLIVSGDALFGTMPNDTAIKQVKQRNLDVKKRLDDIKTNIKSKEAVIERTNSDFIDTKESQPEKEDDKKTKMHKLVTKVANKNINMISEFQKLHPEWKKCSSKYADQHNKIVIESMGGKGDNEYEKQEKIIKKIAKEVFVEKCL